MKVTAENRKARYDYFIEDSLECGIELKGTETKSIRGGKASIKEAWVSWENGELFIRGMHVAEYEFGNRFNYDPLRPKKLLAHKREIQKLHMQQKVDGYTLVPLKVYINDRGKIKVEVGVCKGKKNYDKRQSLKEKDAKREMERHKE